MKPSRDDDAIVDLVDVILRDGVVLQADVIITVGDVPLVGLSLRAALAGMATMTEHGVFTEWDERQRRRALDREESEGRPGGRSTPRTVAGEREGRPGGGRTERPDPETAPEGTGLASTDATEDDRGTAISIDEADGTEEDEAGADDAAESGTDGTDAATREGRGEGDEPEH